MGIVKLNGDFRGEAPEAVVFLEELPHYIADSTGNEEVLLYHPQLLALLDCIRWIENLRYGLRCYFLLDSLHVVAAVENPHVEFAG